MRFNRRDGLMIMRAMTGLEVREHYKGAGKGSQHYKWGLTEERNFPSNLQRNKIEKENLRNSWHGQDDRGALATVPEKPQKKMCNISILQGLERILTPYSLVWNRLHNKECNRAKCWIGP